MAATLPYNYNRSASEFEDDPNGQPANRSTTGAPGAPQMYGSNDPKRSAALGDMASGAASGGAPSGAPSGGSTNPPAPPRTFAQMQAEGYARPPMPTPTTQLATTQMAASAPGAGPVPTPTGQLASTQMAATSAGPTPSGAMGSLPTPTGYYSDQLAGAKPGPLNDAGYTPSTYTAPQLVNGQAAPSAPGGAGASTPPPLYPGGATLPDGTPLMQGSDIYKYTQGLLDQMNPAPGTFLSDADFAKKQRIGQLQSGAGSGGNPMTMAQIQAFINDGTPAETNRDIVYGATIPQSYFGTSSAPSTGGAQAPSPASATVNTNPVVSGAGMNGNTGIVPPSTGSAGSANANTDLLGILTGGASGQNSNPVQGATQQAALDMLKNPSPYGTKQVQDAYNWLGGQIDDQYALKQKQLGVDMARRGLGASSINAGNLNDLNIGRRSAKEGLAENLGQNLAQSLGQYQANAINTGNAVGNSAAGNQLSWVDRLMGYGQNAFNNDLQTNALNQQGQNSYQDFILRLLGLGYGG